jgi:hypothetical protein
MIGQPEHHRSSAQPLVPADLRRSYAPVDRTMAIFAARKQDASEAIAEAIVQIHSGHGSQTALRDMRASLLSMLALFDRDPGLEVAADDLYDAALALASLRRSEAGREDVRLRRILNDANRRFELRVGSASHTDESQILRFS